MSFLEQLTIASPCPANWEDMSGDEQTRFCDLCQKNVYNLSSMTSQEATSLIKKTQGDICIRMYRRADGTVLTQDCPIGLQKRFERKVRYKRKGIAAVITLVTIVGLSSSYVFAESTKEKFPALKPPAPYMGSVVMSPEKPHENQPPKKPVKQEQPFIGQVRSVEPTPPPVEPVMGKYMVEPPKKRTPSR